MIDVMKRNSNWLNSVQIFSLNKKIIIFKGKENQEKHGGSFIDWSYNLQNYIICAFLTFLQAYPRSSNDWDVI
jgi:hypothetical protein